MNSDQDGVPFGEKRDVPPISAQLLKLEDYRDGWRADLLYNSKKRPLANFANAIIAFRGAPEWQGGLAEVAALGNAALY